MFRDCLVVAALLFVVPTLATLSVYNLQALGSSDPALQNISFSIANYGFAPFGKTIVGKLLHSPNFGDQCTFESDPQQDYQNSFLLIPRGECQFVTKTLNAQRLGAQMAIIMDDDDHTGTVVMADNGDGYKVTIPSIFINHETGQKLKQLLLDNEQSDLPDVLLKISFDNQKTQKVDMSLFLQGNNRHSYRFVSNFRKYYSKIKDYVNLQIIHSNQQCDDCPITDCYHSRDYCAYNYIEGESTTGQLILDQQLREHIIFNTYPDQWWEYMKYVGDQCAVVSEFEACQEQALDNLGIDAKEIKQKLEQSFTDGKQNSLLNADREYLSLSGVNRFPAVALNKAKIRGNLQAQFVFDDICNTLSSPPSQCQKYVSDQTLIEQNVSMQWPTLVLLISGAIIFFSFIFCLYRRHMKKKISSEMQGRVDDMVSKYIEFYSQRNK